MKKILISNYNSIIPHGKPAIKTELLRVLVFVLSLTNTLKNRVCECNQKRQLGKKKKKKMKTNFNLFIFFV